jgi:outer membrane lipoprotein-sorting protein
MRFQITIRTIALAMTLATGAAAAVATGAVATGAATPAAAAPAPVSVKLTPDQQADLARVEQYMNGLRTLTARFQQFSENGGYSDGQLFVNRPGKMRFQYNPPAPILIVADGRFVAYEDKELKQVSYLPLGQTPAWFLLRNDIKLGGDVTVTRFEKTPGIIRVTLVETGDPGNGTVTLVLSDQPMALRQWQVVDGQGHTTTVALSDLRADAPVDADLFRLPAATARKN